MAERKKVLSSEIQTLGKPERMALESMILKAADEWAENVDNNVPNAAAKNP